jgi:hypothetical protein
MSLLDEALHGAAPKSVTQEALSGADVSRGRARAVGQGAAFGFGDELTSALVAAAVKFGDLVTSRSPEERQAAPSYGEVYRSVVESERLEQRRYQEARPGESLALEVAGGAGAGGALLRTPAALASRVPSWLQAVGTGAFGGGLYGAGTAEEGGRTAGAAVGAAAGAVAGPVAAGGLRIGGRLISATGRTLWQVASRTPQKRATGMVREALRQSDISPDEAVAMLRELGDDAMLFEVGEGTRALARALYRDTPLARSLATKKLTARQAGAGERIIQLVGKAAGGPEEYQALHKGITRSMQAKAAPLYEQAYSYKLNINNMSLQVPGISGGEPRLIPLAEFLSAPSLKQAINRASKLAADDFQTIDNNVMALDYIQRALYDIGKRYKPGTNQHRILMNNQQAIVRSLEETVPEFGAARALWRGGKAQKEAAVLGRNIFRGNQDEIVEAVTKMSDAELQALRAGTMRAIVDKVKGTPEGGNALRTIIGKPRNRELIDLIFPDGAFDKLLPKLAGEQAKFRSFSDVLQGSRTAMIQGESLIGDELMSIASQSHDFPSAVIKLLKTYGFGDATGETLAELTKMLFRKPSERWLRQAMQAPPKVLAPTISPSRAAGIAGGGLPPVTDRLTP